MKILNRKAITLKRLNGLKKNFLSRNFTMKCSTDKISPQFQR